MVMWHGHVAFFNLCGMLGGILLRKGYFKAKDLTERYLLRQKLTRDIFDPFQIIQRYFF